ncbi:MAG: hypothetical protein AUJ39_01955 [Parcubacteria group bacterium CG1_02_42_13]|nr:MAG: hypothetical protein AUJ39_01955 [Parcubacteria group bacterium CG1_02_42_13]
MVGHLLITRPEHDYATRYLSAWSEKLFDLIKSKGYLIIDLYRERANRKEIESVLSKRNSDLVIINGHGSDDAVAGHDNNLLIKAGDNSSLLSNKITYAISCRSARVLGKEIAQNAETAYIGYKDDFIFVYLEKYRTRPIEDKFAGLFLGPSNLVVTTLLKGHSAKESVSRARQEFLRNIQGLLTSKVKSDDSSALRYLVWDMRNLVLQGDVNKSLF